MVIACNNRTTFILLSSQQTSLLKRVTDSEVLGRIFCLNLLLLLCYFIIFLFWWKAKRDRCAVIKVVVFYCMNENIKRKKRSTLKKYAAEKTRTSTGFLPLPPQGSASAIPPRPQVLQQQYHIKIIFLSRGVFLDGKNLTARLPGQEQLLES